MNRPLAVALFAALSVLPLSAQQTKVLAPHRPIAPRLPDNPPKTGPLRSMVGGLWMIDANFKSTIYIKNSVEIASVTVTPILYLSNGKKVTLADVTLAPSGVATVSVNDGLSANGISPWATLSGYVEIQYKWPWDPLCETVSSVDTVHSTIFTNGLRPLEPMNPSAQALLAKGAFAQTMEGMWWKQEPQVSGFVALSNTTTQAMNAQLEVSDGMGRSLADYSITISPHGTRTVNLDELQSSRANAGGLRITYTGGFNDLLPNGGLEDQASGYSASIPFVPAPNDSKMPSMTYAELGLMSGAADRMMKFPAGTTFTPYSLLRNVGQQSAIATPSIFWMQGGAAKSAQLQPIKLQPYQTENLNIPSLLSLAGLSNFNGGFNLIFDVQGSVLMSSGSVDEKNTYVFEVMPTSIKESASKSIGYWSTKNNDDTMVTIWNPADEIQDFVFTVFFSGGQYDLPISLGPRVTRMFNMSELIQNQIPDKNGNLIPLGLQEGAAQISGAKAGNEQILVAVDGGIYNVRKATCAYTCINCNGTVSFVFLGPGPVPIGGFAQASMTATWNTGQQFNLTTVSTWSSTNTGLATVGNSAGSKGLTAAIAVGNVTINGEDVSEPWAGQNCGSPPASCPYDTGVSGGGGGPITNNTPILTGIDPSDWPSGATTPSVTFTGQYFGTNAPSLTFLPSSGIRYSLGSYSDTQIVANITVPSGTPTEDVDVSVTNNGYGGQAFQSGGGSVSATSEPVYATVRAPINSVEITIIAWINGNAPDLNPLPTGENSTLQSNLQNGTTSQQATCALQVTEWILGLPVNVSTSADSAYANAWLIKNSANTTPPSTITPETQKTGGNYRLINDFGNGKSFVNIGHTPDPCKTGLADWASAGEANQYNGYSSTSPAGQVYQIAEGRIGKAGQLGGETINGGRTVPWVWSVIEFNSANGTPNYSPPMAMFPTYYLYVNGTLTYTFPQSALATFTAKDQTYQLTPSQIP